MDCRCDELTQLVGEDAYRYANEHLHRLATDYSGWVTEYECPCSDNKWLMEYPDSQLHGGGLPSLTRLPWDAKKIADVALE